MLEISFKLFLVCVLLSCLLLKRNHSSREVGLIEVVVKASDRLGFQVEEVGGGHIGFRCLILWRILT